MRSRKINRVLLLAALLLGSGPAAQSQENGTPTAQSKSGKSWLAYSLSDQDKLLAISSIEWGVPDRWSFTSRYVHMFDKERDGKRWLNNFTISVSPGTDGGRLGIGYLGIFSPHSLPDFSLLSEFRVVFLRTWRNPLATEADRSFIGVELRSGVGFANLGVGYYTGISSSADDRECFWGMHIGLGI